MPDKTTKRFTITIADHDRKTTEIVQMTEPEYQQFRMTLDLGLTAQYALRVYEQLRNRYEATDGRLSRSKN